MVDSCTRNVRRAPVVLATDFGIYDSLLFAVCQDDGVVMYRRPVRVLAHARHDRFCRGLTFSTDENPRTAGQRGR